MKILAYAIDLVNDSSIIKKYKEYHRNVFPEVLAAGEKQGILDQKIFLLGNRLFMVLRATDDYDPAAQSDYIADERCAEWDEMMRSFQIPLSSAAEGEWWAQMELVYDKAWYKDIKDR
ncbi:MAG: L-rhamnose mutarotase [Oscillospiraceae bacterium]|nr:L-rhamnose mutarotase [Oscillospiraceae bacterium]